MINQYKHKNWFACGKYEFENGGATNQLYPIFESKRIQDQLSQI